MNNKHGQFAMHLGMKVFLFFIMACLIQVSLQRGSHGQDSAALGGVLAPGSRLWLEGDSTLHKWSSEATSFRVEIPTTTASDSKGTGSLLDASEKARVERFLLEIEAGSLKSHKDGLDKNLLKRIKAAEFPLIRFQAHSLRVEQGEAGAPPLSLVVTGILSLAGVDKEIEVSAKPRFEEKVLVVEGEKDLLMTDFGIKPPVMMLGALKTKNEVRVRFLLKLASAPQTQNDKKEEVDHEGK